MSDWKDGRIKDFGRVVTGKTPPKEQGEYFDGNELFVSPKDMGFDSSYITTTQTRISEKALSKFKNQVIPKNAVMFTSLSYSFGKMGLASRECLTNQQINSIIVNKNHDYRFVYYLLRVYRPTIFSFNSGIDTPLVPKSVFENVKVKYPSLPTQKKIASILSAYDNLIENNKRRIALLEKMAEEIYREWFVRMRFSSFAEASDDKPGAEKVKGLPQGWSEQKLSDIADLTMGQSPKSEFYNTLGEGLPFHQGVGTYGDRFPITENYCSVDGRLAKKGDILFSVRAPVGRLNIADRKMIIGRGLAAIRHKEGLNSYLYYLLKVAFSREDIIGNGAIFNSVGRDELKGFPILKVPHSLVDNFEKVASQIDQQIEVLIRSNEKLQLSRDLLLPRLISGKLSVDNISLDPVETAEQMTSQSVEAAHA